MTTPIRPRPNPPLGSIVQQMGPGSEWALYEHELRNAQVRQLLDSLRMTAGVSQRPSLSDQNTLGRGPGQVIQYGQRPGGRPNWDEEMEDLIAAGRFYGFQDPEHMPPDALRAAVEQERARRDPIAAQGTGLLDALAFSAQMSGLSLERAALGALEGIAGLPENIPFIGDWLAEVTHADEAEMWFKKLEEGVRYRQPEGFETIGGVSEGVGFMGSMIYPGTASLKAASLAGKLPLIARYGARMTPIARAAVRGSAATWLLEGGSDRSMLEKGFIIGAGGALDAGVAYALERQLLQRAGAALKRRFPSLLDQDVTFPTDRRGEATITPSGHQTRPIDTEWAPNARSETVVEPEFQDARPSIRVLTGEVGTPEQRAYQQWRESAVRNSRGGYNAAPRRLPSPETASEAPREPLREVSVDVETPRGPLPPSRRLERETGMQQIDVEMLGETPLAPALPPGTPLATAGEEPLGPWMQPRPAVRLRTGQIATGETTMEEARLAMIDRIVSASPEENLAFENFRAVLGRHPGTPADWEEGFINAAGEFEPLPPPRWQVPRAPGNMLANTKVVNPDGTPKVVYHGTKRVYDEYDPTAADPGALFGPGYYTTDDPEIAGGRLSRIDETLRSVLPKAEIRRLDGELESLEAAEMRLVEAREAGTISVDDYNTQIAPIWDRQADIRAMLQGQGRDLNFGYAGEWPHPNDLDDVMSSVIQHDEAAERLLRGVRTANDEDYIRTLLFGDSSAGPPFEQIPLSEIETALANARGDLMEEVGVLSLVPSNVRLQRLRIENPFDIDQATGDIGGLTPGTQRILAIAKRRFPNARWQIVDDAVAGFGQPGYNGGTNEHLYNSLVDVISADMAQNAPSGSASMRAEAKFAVRDILEEAGYDGIKHIGGARTGNDPHRVWIAFHPDQIHAPWDGPVLEVDNAASEAAALTKQALGFESPELPTLLNQAAMDEVDIATAAMASEPGTSAVVVPGVAESPEILERTLAAGGRLVKHPSGRTDILMGPGVTDAAASEYETFGLFTRQKVLVKGVEGVVSQVRSPSGKVVVTRVGGGPPLRVNPNNVHPLPFADVVEAPQEMYDGLQAYVQKALAAEGITADWIDPIVSVKLPRLMGAYLDEAGVTDPTARGALVELFNRNRVLDYKMLAPDDMAHAEEVIEAAQRAMGSERVETTVADLAAEKGMMYVPSEQGGPSGFIWFRDGDTKIPVASDEAAEEFIRNTYRPLPDVGPVGGDVPVEAMPVGPYGPGFDKETVMTPEDIPWIDTPDGPMLGTPYIQQILAGPPRQPPLETPAVDWDEWSRVHTAEGQRWPEPPGGDAYRIPLEPPSGPPVPPGGASGGWGSEPPFPPPAPRVGEGPGPEPAGLLANPFNVDTDSDAYKRMIREAARKAHPHLGDIERAYDGFVARYLVPMRNRFLGLEQRFLDIGMDVARPWQMYEQVTQAKTAMHNEAHPWMDEWAEIMAQFRRKLLRKGYVTRIHELTDDGERLRAMAEAGYTDAEFAADNRITDFHRRFFQFLLGDKAFTIRPEQEIYRYISHIRSKQFSFRRPLTQADWERGARKYLSPETQFFAQYAREGNIDFREMDARVIGHHMIRAAMWHKHMARPWKDAVNTWRAFATADPTGNAARLANIMLDWLNVVRTGYDATKDVMAQGVRGIFRRFGLVIDEREAIDLVQMAQLASYRAMLGGRPQPIFRDLMQPFLAATKVGYAQVGKTYKQFLRGTPEEARAMIERAYAKGWVEKALPQIEMPGPMETPIFTSAGLQMTLEQAQRREFIATIGDAVRDALPPRLRHIQGTWLDPMMAYAKVGNLNRMISGETGYRIGTEALRRYRAGQIDFDGLMGETTMRTFDKPIRERFKQLVELGADDDAATLLGNELANWSQHRYGLAEAPSGLRTTPGRIAMQFGNFTLQYIQTMKSGLANGTLVDKAAFFARYGAFSGALAYATAKTGWNFGSWMWHTSLTYMGGPAVEPIMTAIQAAKGAVTEEDYRSLAEQEAMRKVGEWSPGEFLGYFNPWRGVGQTVSGVEQMSRSPEPGEATARFLVTGERTDLGFMRMLKDQSNAPLLPVESPVRANAIGVPTPDTPPWHGVADTTRIYEKNGARVVDTYLQDRAGHVPTHRVDQASRLLQPGQTWEQLEWEVLNRPLESFGADTAAVRDIQALQPDVRQAFLGLAAQAQEDGIPLRVWETNRTQERQNYLFRQGRVEGEGPGPVTWTLTSNHFGGRALDIDVMDPRTRAWLQATAPRFGFQTMGDIDPGHIAMPVPSTPPGGGNPANAARQWSGREVPRGPSAMPPGVGGNQALQDSLYDFLNSGRAIPQGSR